MIPHDNSPGVSRRHGELFAGMALAIFVFIVYWPAATVEFVRLDDWQYVVENPIVREPSWPGVARVFSEVRKPSTVDGYYQPLTMASLMLDTVLSGGDVPAPFVFRLTNIFFHALASIAVMLILREAVGGVWIPLLIAALFAVHPVQVESVAWISQRKAVLSGWLALSATWCYLRYRRSTHPGWMAGAVLSFCLAILSKPTAVLIPLTWPLLDIWPLGVRRKWGALAAPFAVMLVAGTIAWSSQADSGANLAVPSASRALSIAAVVLGSIGQYLINIFVPMELAPYREIRGLDGFQDPVVILGGAALAAAAWRFRRSAPVVGVVSACFLMLLAPAVGIVLFDETVVADRFLYLPLAFAMPAAACLAKWVVQRWPQWRLAGVSVLGTILIAASALNWAQQRVWHDSIALWTHIIDVCPRLPKARNALANTMLDLGMPADALIHAEAAAQAMPENGQYAYTLGRALIHSGRAAESIEALRRALALGFGSKKAWCHAVLARAYILLDDPTAARAQLKLAQAAGDVDASEYVVLGEAALSRPEGAVMALELFDQAIARGGPVFLWQWKRGEAMAHAGRLEEALAVYDRVLTELDRAKLIAPDLFIRDRAALAARITQESSSTQPAGGAP